jgi:uncharacterized SAM-binding protein YcdF (DUF218 family)
MDSFGFLLKKTLTVFFLPPGIFLVLLVAGMFLVKRRFRSFLFGLFLLLYLLSIEPTKDLLLSPLENRYPIPSWSEIQRVDAIVVLGGGVLENAPDVDGPGALSSDSLVRVVAGYKLYARVNKPIIVAGGSVFGSKPEAEVSRDTLYRLGVKQEFVLIEPESKDTNENALFVSAICKKRNWNKIALVTSAYHMRRSLMLFGRFFNDIVPCPTDYKTLRRGYGYWSLLPDATSLADTAIAVKEYLGIIYYKITLRSS